MPTRQQGRGLGNCPHSMSLKTRLSVSLHSLFYCEERKKKHEWNLEIIYRCQSFWLWQALMVPSMPEEPNWCEGQVSGLVGMPTPCIRVPEFQSHLLFSFLLMATVSWEATGDGSSIRYLPPPCGRPSLYSCLLALDWPSPSCLRYVERTPANRICLCFSDFKNRLKYKF